MRSREMKKGYKESQNSKTDMKEISPTYSSRYKTEKDSSKTMKLGKATYPSRY